MYIYICIYIYLHNLRSFCDRHGSLLSQFSSEENASETENKWEVTVLEEVTAAYLTQVLTVKT
jgi:hypothetical protein